MDSHTLYLETTAAIEYVSGVLSSYISGDCSKLHGEALAEALRDSQEFLYHLTQLEFFARRMATPASEENPATKPKKKRKPKD